MNTTVLAWSIGDALGLPPGAFTLIVLAIAAVAGAIAAGRRR